MEIIGALKSYDWGKMGENSEVAKLAVSNCAEFIVHDDVPYAELWMGDHPSGPSTLKSNGKQLGEVLLGEKLPFLFKVLSVRTALSIQVHPNKAEAERLHKQHPDIYKDANHKPELAIALTPFLALCGFRPYAEIRQLCAELPPLQSLIGGAERVEQLKDATALKQCYERLMTSDATQITQCIDAIAENCEQVLSAHDLLDIFRTVNADFPRDVGVLSLFFLNLLQLQPGQALFLAANEIHAYLSGDCIECMACSDNVIRAGLTPKYKDVAQLISCLNYAGLPASNKIFQPHFIDEHLQLFVPPVEDFAVAVITLPADLSEYHLQIQPYGSILLVVKGERFLHIEINGVQSELYIKRGSIVYIPPEAAPDVELVVDAKMNADFKGYMAMFNYFKS